MARKGREPLVEAPPPGASSSDEDEEDGFDEEDQQSAPAPTAEEEEKQSSSIDEEEEKEEEEEGENREENSPSSPPPGKKGPTQKKTEPARPAESDSESDSDSDAPPKPTTEVANPKKPVSKAPPPDSVTVLASPAPAAKRRGSENEKGTPKKARREKVEGGGAAQDEGKKPLFQRLWSEDDEIAILEGMIEYKDKKGDPMADADGFLEFIKKSLHVDVNRGQIVSKVRTLKKKFETAKKKKKITGPHGVKVFELSKMIWESDEVKNNGDVDRKDSNLTAPNVKKRAGTGESLKGGKDIGAVLEDEKQEEGEERVKNLVISRGEKELQLQDLGSFGFLNDGFLKEGMKLIDEGVKLIDEGEKAKLEEKWREQNMAELEIYVERLDLIHELVQKTLDAVKST